MDMEQITVSITGKGEQEQAARIMKAIYKTMVHADGKRCRVTISNQKEEQGYEEIQVPDFMQVRFPVVRGRMG